MKYESSLKPKLIYVFRINDKAHRGCLKIGEATIEDDEGEALVPNSRVLNKAAKKRINSYTQTAGIVYDLLYTEKANYIKGGKNLSFSDHEVRKVLSRSGLEKKVFDTENKANEWFITDLETVKKAITAVKDGRSSLHASEVTEDQTPIEFRPEQREAIEKAKKRFKKGNKMLWNAKMRFGKTLSAHQVVKDHQFTRTLILTHRPVVDKGWYEDFGKIFYDSPEYSYGSKKERGDEFTSLEKRCIKGKTKYIYFASMQDLRGSKQVGGGHEKNDDVFDTPWDLIIIDEAHEGTQTELGRNVLNALEKEHTKFLHLSGTPFNLLDDYHENEIYTWDYVMEQKAKMDWDKIHFGDPNPYASLPKLNIFTYDLGKLLHGYIDEEVAFNFKEFFRVDETGSFLHESDVKSFLDLICKEDKESNYPYSTDEYRDNFRHSLWMVPGVKEARALSKMLQEHPVLGQFEIVNVAGDGDEEEANEDALKKVDKAISDKPHETRTITLSCGRLTTGVSVKAWTAVFMISGSHNTAASAYMQTIFRVQTPATINGKVKEECFVFDFAPDRTLKVIAETAKISAKAGKTTESDRKIMGEFLNFCPIISMGGSQMRTYDVNSMLEQLKKVAIERVVNNGFEDGMLYNDDLLFKLEAIELKEFDGLKKIIGSTKAMAKTNEIDINKQGFTDEEYEEVEKAKKKPKKQLTEEEKQLLKERAEQKKARDAAISILRGISIRMPLLIYGADVSNEDTELTIDNFTELVDDQSWTEFMPKGVTKDTFLKFKKYYEPDVFRAAGKRIRALARAADNLTVEERIDRITSIFKTFRNPDKETVLTPWRVVNMHLGDCLGGYSFLDESREKTVEHPKFVSHATVTDDVFATDSKILEINSKSGLYPLYMTYSIFRNRVKEKHPNKEANELTVEEQRILWDKTVDENIFVLCKTEMAKSITKRTLSGFREASVNTRYFEDLLNQITNKSEKFLAKIKRGSYWKSNLSSSMKFNAIVGNPPYQNINENTSDTPIYNHFMDISFKISSKVTFITPARFLFDAGKTPKDWNKKMLNDEHFKVVWYKSKSTDVFPTVDIKGGVAVTFRDADQVFGKIGLFTSYPELKEIGKKVEGSSGFEPISNIIHLQNKFDLNALYSYDEKLKGRIGSGGRERRLTTPIFTQLEVFKDESEKKKTDIRIIGLIKNKRVFKWIRKDFLDDHANLHKYKVLVTAANGTGALGETLSTPLVIEPGTGFTFSFLSFGEFTERNQADAALKYVKTKFVRTLLGILKVTQHNLPGTWSKVPLQDFTNKSNINWKKSVAEIDKQLYANYNLSKEEIDFIEKMIKPMA